MNRRQFWTSLLLLHLILIFVKIYQHNHVLKHRYAKQKLVRLLHEKKREKDRLLVSLYELKKQSRVRKLARNKLTFKPLALKQIIAISTASTTQHKKSGNDAK